VIELFDRDTVIAIFVAFLWRLTLRRGVKSCGKMQISYLPTTQFPRYSGVCHREKCNGKRIPLSPLTLQFDNMIIYQPRILVKPARIIDVESAWKGLEKIIKPLMDDFEIRGNKALEFGVDFGYSTAVLANFFKEVTGVDTFEGDLHTNQRRSSFVQARDNPGDIHSGQKPNAFDQAKNNLAGFGNVRLVKANYKDFIKADQGNYDLIHVDIVHTYDETLECGLWSVQHAKAVIFHDTESFPAVKRAVETIAVKTAKKFYNFPYYFGLGIIV
jgi:Methyltransferase domain